MVSIKSPNILNLQDLKGSVLHIMQGKLKVYPKNLAGYMFKTKWPITSSPSISSGIIYFGTVDGYLYALNTDSGEELWKFKTNRKIISSPTIANGVIYFGSFDKHLYALQ